MSCNNIPIKLVLATTDPKLYNNDKWLWGSQLYWAVECLPVQQTTISDRLIPQINPDGYLPLVSNPATWDYCKSARCNPHSEKMQLVFTFDPASTNPNDYLQFVIDISCNVTDSPQHFITDKKGNKIYLDIVEVSKMTRHPYVELWIAQSNKEQALNISGLQNQTLDIETSPVQNSKEWIWITLAILLSCSILVAGVLLMYRYMPRNTNVSVGAGNIY